jgi:uroporphyrin-III C-methyltransferase
MNTDSSQQGCVYLVGAGPGDPEMLTLKAARLLREADVVLADDLVGDGVLAMIPSTTRVIHVGKRGGCKSTPQRFIESLMIREALAGNKVVRLKGGDPYVFGRGGEERQALMAAGIACEVVNGITAGLAAPTSIGIPLTHRDFCHGAIFVTGHAGEESATPTASASVSPNWGALVATGLPLVIYMGVSRIAEIVDALLAGGMSSEMPVAVVQNASQPSARALVTNVGQLVDDVRAAGLGSPAILIVGRTVSLANVHAHAVPIAPAVAAHG